MISKECLNYWWPEIKKEWDVAFEYPSYSKKRIFNGVIYHLSNYDERKYPGKERHDEYINSDKWKRRRQGYLTGDLFCNGLITCSICGLSENISEYPSDITWNLHHNRYKNFAQKIFYVEANDLSILDSVCHESLHVNIDTILEGSNRALFIEHRNRNGKFFDSYGRLRFGKYKGIHIDEVPSSYLSWVEKETDSDYDLELLESKY